MRLAELNALDPATAERELRQCCGSTRWARGMAAARPFPNIDAVLEASDRIWSGLDREEWLEAFAAHPRIGDRTKPEEAQQPREIGKAGKSDRGERVGERGKGETTGASRHERWSADEQSGVTDDSRAQLLALNRAYEQRFGYIFIICATGKTGDQMRRALERRMRNNPDDEIREAAEEQRTIARLRLTKLLA